MPKSKPLARTSSLALLLLATLLTGCPATDDYGKVVDHFQASSGQLTAAYRSLLEGANLVEQDAFIDAQVFEAQPVDPAAIHAHALLTPEQIKLRTTAIQALADYTAALATLAEGKPSVQLQADTAKASKSAGDLTRQVANAGPSATPADFSGPIASAVTGIGDFLAFIEKRRGEAEVKQSLQKNDPELTALFNLLSSESTSLYARRKATLGQTGIIVFRNYAVARQRTPANAAELLQLSDRIKGYERDTALLADADPSPALQAFKDAHDKLVAAVLAPREKKKGSLADLIASVKSFASEVSTLASTTPAPSRTPTS